MKYIPLMISFVLFILLCVSGSYWVMRLVKPEVRKVSVTQESPSVADVESVAGLFGGAMLADTSYQLKGLIQANPMNQSVAIIAMDGKPTKAYPFNAQINPGSELSEVYFNHVLLMDNGISKRVDLPKEFEASLSEFISPLNRQPFQMPSDMVDENQPANSRGGALNNRRALNQHGVRLASPLPPGTAPSAPAR